MVVQMQITKSVEVLSIIAGVVHLLIGAKVTYDTTWEARLIKQLESHTNNNKYNEDNVMFPNVFLPFVIATGCIISALSPYFALQIINIVLTVAASVLQGITLIMAFDISKYYKEDFRRAKDDSRNEYQQSLHKMDKYLTEVQIQMLILLACEISTFIVLLVPFCKCNEGKTQGNASPAVSQQQENAPVAPNAPNAPISPMAPNAPISPIAPNAPIALNTATV